MASEEIENLNLSLDIVSNVLKGNDTSTKDMVLNYLLMISSREDDDQLLKTSLVLDLIDVIERNPNDIGELASKVLVNVSSQEKGARTIIGASENAVERLLQVCLNPESPLSDSTSKLLANLTRTDDSAKIVSQTVLGNPKYFSSILEAISNKEYNKHSQRLEYMAHVVGNLSQARDFQNCLLNPSNNDNINRILPVITNSPSSVERFGVASAVYNCLFDSSNHETLMDPPYEVLPTLLLPLAGPEEFDAEDYDKMPLELQYLPDDKKRDDCASTRNIILRALLHLCSTKKVRTRVRDLNTYLILREYHKWEKDRQNLLAAENIIDILIRTEDEIGVDDLTGLNVPDDLKEKFEKMDKDFLADE